MQLSRPNTYFRTHKRILGNSIQKRGAKNCDRTRNFFQRFDIPKISEYQAKLCQEDLAKKIFIQFSDKHAN